MKSVSRRILELFERYYTKRAEERVIQIVSFAHSLMEGLDYDVAGYYVDENRIIKAIDSYFLDVIKYKEYHFNCEKHSDVNSQEWASYIHVEKKINDSKVAAFSAKWLLKASPIFILPKDGTPIVDDFLCHINEFFALNCVLYCLLQYDYDLIDEDDYKKLFYDFKYRMFDERSYFSRFELLEKNAKAKKELKELEESISGDGAV